MAIRFVCEDAVFCGWRVMVFIRGKKFQKNFSARCHFEGVDPDVWRRYQRLRAHYYHAKWGARAAALNYIDFLRCNSQQTKPYRGVGFQGITLGIGQYQKNRRWYCYFVVNDSRNPRRIPITAKRGLTESWITAVELWGRRFDIRPKDVQEKKNQVPSRRQFKLLWKRMNEEGRSIPVEALYHVFRENQRENTHHARGTESN